MSFRQAMALLGAFSLVACSTTATAPGARGHTQPRHIKPDSYEKRNVPRTPMRTHHVLEVSDDCGNECDFRQTADSTLTMHLQDNGVAHAEDAGELVEQLKSKVTTSSQQTKWTRSWSGSWTEGEDTLDVVLKPDEVGCTRTDESGTVDEGCAKQRELHLRCKLVSLSLVRPRNKTTRAWACRARGFRKTASITPLPWVFGISDSVVVLDGGNSHDPTRRYALDKKSSAPPAAK